MASEMKYKMSRERYEELVKELEYMQTVRDKEVSEQIKEARSFGDLSENSEYDEAKSEQAKLYNKIAEVKNLIENAEIIEKTKVVSDTVGLGSKVLVEEVVDGDDEPVQEHYQIVGSQEANPMEGRISDDSPFGRGLMGHKVGEIALIEAPAGQLHFKILEVVNE